MPLRDPSPGPYRAGIAPHDVRVKGREGKGIVNWFTWRRLLISCKGAGTGSPIRQD